MNATNSTYYFFGVNDKELIVQLIATPSDPSDTVRLTDSTIPQFYYLSTIERYANYHCLDYERRDERKAKQFVLIFVHVSVQTNCCPLSDI